MDLAAEVAHRLLQINAIKLSPQKPFTWASGMQSPIYCDNRTALSFPEVRRFIIKGFAQASAIFQPFNVVAGVATAGIPHGALLAEELGLPFVYVRSKAKSHGRQNQIEGVLPEGARVLVIEDLISTGGSALKAVEALREANADVVGVMAIFSYGFDKARTAFEAAGTSFATLSTYDALLKAAAEAEYIAPEEMDTLEAWRKSPETWGK
ncbi:orotate phosphoribosyltransferase [Phaeodactylibacter xiamenensis]|jgi:orotate phosphoribosyltransferase|uniref:orotate phosphoribosyltransferase n=1 Tax=Phaeodactylibacter xiamenensis TaxID=1524460 RepID=UPI0024A849E4|nr:orotate phosphoribosyltransferase [Phaeodactylibacter xiamenensis]